jgi:hypothetical protein
LDPSDELPPVWNSEPIRRWRFTASCQPGSEVYLWARLFVGDVMVEGAGWASVLKRTAKRPGIHTGAPVRRIGTTGVDGVAEVTLRVEGQTRLPAAPIGCLDRAALDSAVDKLNQSKPAAAHFGGHSVDVQLKPGTPGNVVIAVDRTPGWQRSVDARRAASPSR